MCSPGGAGPQLALGRGQWAADLCRCDAEGRGASSKRDIEGEGTMARTAEDVLEFAKRRELPGLRPTYVLRKPTGAGREPGPNRRARQPPFHLRRQTRRGCRPEPQPRC